MKRIVGSPGTWSGMALRLSQCAFAAGSSLAMCSAFGFSNYSAYLYSLPLLPISFFRSYMNLVLVVQLLWSLGLACQDIFSLRNEKDLHALDFLLFTVIIDWAMAIFMFSGFCAAASLTIFFKKDMNFCAEYSRLACSQFTLSVTLAFITCLLQAASSFSGFWLLVSFF